MKTSPFSLLALLLLLASCSGEINDLDRSGLKGNVKSIKEKQYDATYKNDKWVAGDPMIPGYRIINYDSNGLYLELLSMGGNGDTTAIATCKRENGEMVEERYQSLYNRQTSRTILERVSKEQVNFELWKDDQLQYEGANYFDSKGKLVKQVQVVNDREVIMHHIFEKNLLVESYQEELDGERTATRMYEYPEFDDVGNWTVQLVYMEEDKITPRIVITRELSYY
ncbi:MAG: hypothetical protein KAT15_32110 [Bacteroidales bacterium]|nr:hypothetical protein [Bacteroidales bacterium]